MSLESSTDNSFMSTKQSQDLWLNLNKTVDWYFYYFWTIGRWVVLLSNIFLRADGMFYKMYIKANAQSIVHRNESHVNLSILSL